MHETILKPSYKAQNSFWNSHTGGMWDKFPQVQLTKMSRVLEIAGLEYLRVTQDILSSFLHSKKYSHGICAIWI